MLRPFLRLCFTEICNNSAAIGGDSTLNNTIYVNYAKKETNFCDLERYYGITLHFISAIPTIKKMRLIDRQLRHIWDYVRKVFSFKILSVITVIEILKQKPKQLM